MINWYYVDGTERVGPVEESVLKKLFLDSKINQETYVWKKGFPNWERLKNVHELNFNIDENIISQTETIEDTVLEVEPFSWLSFDEDEAIFFVRTGLDRHNKNHSYFGPYSSVEILAAIEQKRMNEKTDIFSLGMDSWQKISSSPYFCEKLNLNALSVPGRECSPCFIFAETEDENHFILITEKFKDHYKGISLNKIREGEELFASAFKGTQLLEKNIECSILKFDSFDHVVEVSLKNFIFDEIE